MMNNTILYSKNITIFTLVIQGYDYANYSISIFTIFKNFNIFYNMEIGQIPDPNLKNK